MTHSSSQEMQAKIMRDLEEIYELSKRQNKFNQALRAKELMAKINGFLQAQKPNNPLEMKNFNDEELDALLSKLKEKHDARSDKI